MTKINITREFSHALSKDVHTTYTIGYGTLLLFLSSVRVAMACCNNPSVLSSCPNLLSKLSWMDRTVDSSTPNLSSMIPGSSSASCSCSLHRTIGCVYTCKDSLATSLEGAAPFTSHTLHRKRSSVATYGYLKPINKGRSRTRIWAIPPTRLGKWPITSKTW